MLLSTLPHQKTILLFFLIACSLSVSIAQSNKSKWVDSVYNSLTLKERVAQLINIRVVSDKKPEKNELTFDQVKNLIEKFQLGGITFFKGDAETQIKYTNKLQSISKTPLMVAMDVEWGAGMRLKNVDNLPYQMTLGATYNKQIAFEYGEVIAAHCKRLGVHLCFAPVLDINNNPDNPVIGMRSLGENKYWVTKMGISVIKGIQKHGVMACAKHFPGHGDVTRDSHVDLPAINKSFDEIDTFELVPFKEAIRQGVRSIMVGHLFLSKDTFKKEPATISKDLVKRILIDSYQYKGLIITDALNMNGFKKNVNSLTAPIQVINAGNDILLLPENVPQTIETILKAIQNKQINLAEFEHKVKKVLEFKYLYVLRYTHKVDYQNATTDLNNISMALRKKLSKYAITIINSSKQNLIDYIQNENKNNYYIFMGDKKQSALGDLLKKNDKFKVLNINEKTKFKHIKKFLSKAKKDKVTSILIGFGDYGSSAKNKFNIKKIYSKTYKKLSKFPALLILFGNPYVINEIKFDKDIIIAFENENEVQVAIYNILTQKQAATGYLPITLNETYKQGYSFNNSNISDKNIGTLLIQTKPVHHEVIENRKLNTSINKIVNDAIKDSIFPGCRVIVGRANYMLMNKSFGTLNYNPDNPVTNETVYDLASMTKALATTLIAMKTYENNKLSLYKKVKDYLPRYNNSEVGMITIKDLMTHTSGLKSWIPFHLTIPKRKDKKYLSKFKSPSYIRRVSKQYYTIPDTKELILDSIGMSGLLSKGEYLYSDLGFILLGEILKKINPSTFLDFNALAYNMIYKRLGLKSTTYNPSRYVNNEINTPSDIIAPTEIDNYFRHNDTIRGYVHDYTAALLGGISGNAGLFSNGNEISKICHMLLTKGFYGHVKIFNPPTIELFTSQINKKYRRGLGFDKPSLKNIKDGYPSKYSSRSTFGHTGYTGTCFWIDPENDLYYIFLSNRTYPFDTGNNRLAKEHIREKIFDIVYEIALKKSLENKK